MEKKSLYLTGFMGAGKSLIGQNLAHQLEWKHIDLDRMIEQEFGQSVFTLFNLWGEIEFRRLEKEMLRSIGNSKNIVVSLGGGAFLDSENRATIHKEGYSIYLRASVPLLTNRLFIERHHRPLLHKLHKKEDLQKYIQEVLALRCPSYLEANLIVDVDEQSVDQICINIRNYLCL